MKKRYAMLSACLLWGALALPYSVNAAAERPIRVYLDNKLVKFEVQPVLENGTTLVPFRAIFEKLGLTVGWDADTQTVTGTKDGLTIELVIDDTDAYVNEELSELELAPRLVDGNTLVPLRFVSEASGKEVKWVQNTSTIYLTTPKSTTTPGKTGSTGGTANPSKPTDTTTDSSKPVKGEYVYPNGDKYTGMLVDGSPEGKGKLVNSIGKVLFDGTMADGVPKDGRSKSYYDNGQLETDAAMKDGVLSGAGKQYSAAGSLVFDGTFSNGERSNGTLYYENGDKYTGPFDNGQPSGRGKLVYKNGDVYEGDFVDGKRDGKGTYTTSKGEKITGDFRNNMMDGMISYYDKKGTLLSVSEYSNDVLIRKVEIGNDTTTLPNTNPGSQSDPIKQENERHEKALYEIKERYNQDRKQLEDQLAQVRKDSPGAYSSQASYDKALDEARTKHKEILDKINSLSGDSSKTAETARAELEKQLADAQTLIDQIFKKGAAQQQIESLKTRLNELRDGYTAELKKENDRHSYAIKQLK
ncbi:stalk domain-containing protein [Paenibacillus sp. OAS669]|uniref:stalk domain-containing protein n=1 Tax=Paenibacillus sp. OAS669 TaxID=2663821 RepID=UPI00178AD9D2|nr:stalk domain-containing protein [Paenibacillus sp. OAS669]MBE1443740.1 antitoxin component YwqK of YwqJK toxin-antitoxin module [Paenibacillus sp. OAS669]